MPPAYVTKTEVENMLMKALNIYEEKKVAPRHEANQRILRRIERTLWVAYGIFLTVLFALENKGR